MVPLKELILKKEEMTPTLKCGEKIGLINVY